MAGRDADVPVSPCMAFPKLYALCIILECPSSMGTHPFYFPLFVFKAFKTVCSEKAEFLTSALAGGISKEDLLS